MLPNEGFVMSLTVIEIFQIIILITGAAILVLMLIHNGKPKVLAMIPITAIIGYTVTRTDMDPAMATATVLVACLTGLAILLTGD